jgi:hypothetical protein
MVIIDSMVLVEVLRIILSNDPNWYTKSAKKIIVSQADKEKEVRTVRQVFTDRPYRSQNLVEPLDDWTTILDRLSVDHGLSVSWPWIVQPCHMDCPCVLCACEITRLGHKESSISLFQVWINLDGYFQEIDFSKWTEWIYFLKVLNQVDIKFDSI